MNWYHFSAPRKLLLLGMLLVLTLSAVPQVKGSQISYVGGGNNNGASLTSLSVTYTSQGGDTLLVGFIFNNAAGQTISSVTDSGGSSYSKVIEFLPDAIRDIGIWASPSGGSIASTTFKISFSASVPFATMIVEEYSGVNTLGPTTTNSEWVSNSASNITATNTSSNDQAICFFGTPDGLTTWAVTTGTLRHFAIAQYSMESVDNAGGTVCASTPNSPVRWAAVSVDAQPLPTGTITGGSAGTASTPPAYLVWLATAVIATIVIIAVGVALSSRRR